MSTSEKKKQADVALLQLALQELDRLGHSIMEECGQCGCYHPINWTGDCRDDAHRYAGPYGERK